MFSNLSLCFLTCYFVFYICICVCNLLFCFQNCDLFCTYRPPYERVLFLNKVRDAVENCKPEEYLFIGGDFNCTENDSIDRNHKEPHMESQRVLRQIIKEHDLYDIWRVLNKTQWQYTWTQVREYHVTMARLDRSSQVKSPLFI